MFRLIRNVNIWVERRQARHFQYWRTINNPFLILHSLHKGRLEEYFLKNIFLILHSLHKGRLEKYFLKNIFLILHSFYSKQEWVAGGRESQTFSELNPKLVIADNDIMPNLRKVKHEYDFRWKDLLLFNPAQIWRRSGKFAFLQSVFE